MLTGHEQEWFGDSLNANNFVDHSTMNLTATSVATGQTMSIHGNFQDSSTGGIPFVFNGLPPFAQAIQFVMNIVC